MSKKKPQNDLSATFESNKIVDGICVALYACFGKQMPSKFHSWVKWMAPSGFRAKQSQIMCTRFVLAIYTHLQIQIKVCVECKRAYECVCLCVLCKLCILSSTWLIQFSLPLQPLAQCVNTQITVDMCTHNQRTFMYILLLGQFSISQSVWHF